MCSILSSQAEVQGILLLMVSVTFPVALGQQEKASFWNLLFCHPVEYLRIEIRQNGCSHSLGQSPLSSNFLEAWYYSFRLATLT